MDTAVVVIGAGQAGLAMSRRLVERSIDHVVLERGQVANAWRAERWDSLRLLTPNWLSRLPGYHYTGPEPDGFMTAAQVADHLDGYRASFEPPVRTGVTVTAVEPAGHTFRVDTDARPWRAAAVVLATGGAGAPRVPLLAEGLPARVDQRTAWDYRNPGQLADGPVLVVGASASGVQIADELRSAGHEVTVAVGEHVRLPRTYRGMDIYWWLDTLGILDERIEEVPDPERARRLPSLQVVGDRERRTLDLPTLAARGVTLTGRLVGLSGDRLQFSGGFLHAVRSADLKLARLLARIDDHVRTHGLEREVAEPDPPAPVAPPEAPMHLDLGRFRTVIWATGFRPVTPRLPDGLLDRRGVVRHDRGRGTVAGLYVLGLPFLRRRTSSFLDGVGRDATELARDLAGHLDDVAASV